MSNWRAQFIRFSASGAVGTALHYLALVFLVDALGLAVATATLGGFIVGAGTNYILARRFVFATARSHVLALPRFLSVAATGAVLNTFIVLHIYNAGVHYLLAQVAATVVVLAWNFAANRMWTFRD